MSTFRACNTGRCHTDLYFYRTLFFQFRQLFFQAETVEFVDKVRHQLFHALDLFGSPGIDAGESVSCRQVAFEGVVEGHDDAVGAVGYVAGLDTVERTAFGLFQPLFHPFQERVVDGPPRHTHRTLDDLYVLLRGFDVTPLELRRGVALLRGDEARAHLDTVGAQLHDAINVFARVDAACCDDRDVRVVRRAETTDFRNDFGQQPLQREVFVGDLFRLVARCPPALVPRPRSRRERICSWRAISRR